MKQANTATAGNKRARPGPGSIVAVLGALLLGLAAPAAAVDGVSFSGGPDAASNASVDLYRIGVQWDWNKRWLETGNWHLGGYWDLQAGYWDNASDGKTNSGLWELAFTPVLRVQQSQWSAFSPYLELGVGAHLLSETSVSPQRRFSTAFQFGSHAGVGARFGQKNAFELGDRYQHLSNASIKDPNNGINFHVLRFGYWFK
jgi:lipid A 3-O-deacylase